MSGELRKQWVDAKKKLGDDAQKALAKAVLPVKGFAYKLEKKLLIFSYLSLAIYRNY